MRCKCSGHIGCTTCDSHDSRIEWISIKERFPKYDQVCLAFSLGRIYVDHFSEERIRHEKITHWMPLLIPPNQGFQETQKNDLEHMDASQKNKLTNKEINSHGWISTLDELPEIGKDVLVLDCSGKMYQKRRTLKPGKLDWRWTGSEEFIRVYLFWRQLPEKPPKEIREKESLRERHK